ncbi:MAG: phosphoribosyltransferase family protein [Treponema sp.]|jgi:adenine/guanine phosphoribosyltransferase-like PRPP-binding protein|nr:phosphoribosyltransferase family protein [Treponema sp.]
MKVNLQFANRDSRTATRPYVLVNPLLAKHLPSTPSESIDYFSELGKKTADLCKGEKVLVIGFAETATAVGAAVASLIEGAVYIHTTREPLSQKLLAADFSEEHSHAKNQTLFLSEKFNDFNKYDRLIFVEDEITTGKTILNFLKKIKFSKKKIIVSALIFNGFDEKVFSQYDADFCCLQRIGYVHKMSFGDFPNPRLGVNIADYVRKCEELAEWFVNSVENSALRGKNILALGTEEFMYPALALARRLENIAANVVSQSTTRSPLLPNSDPNYPFNSRISFQSVYDSERTTYLYNLDKRDVIIIATDASGNADELIDALRVARSEKIYLVRVYGTD